ncbi:family 20 glycosylhydrolase [Sphingomonas changnyeongensis]|uniref:beta-N-acetylhexosaminidase n=1 Tax=Sphingomonas changnyeongensis TaxID=2698679 RepID=A0A7Z2S5K5_9SPHN|nr:family 20 glycosylhydrolase [Sphingomonas changnyeongensis]QHL91230.1 family 20 glycosylhydrolase [Sphingomonas changnyeongensis]
MIRPVAKAVVAALIGLAAPAAAQSLHLLPQPARIRVDGGSFFVSASTPLTGDADAAAAFADLMRRTTGIAPVIRANGAGSPAIRFRRDPALQPEAYRVVATPRGVTVTGGDRAGLYYGAVTLWQLATRPGRTGELPAVRIDDQPRFGWRGMMLDSARHPQSPAFIRRFIEWMAVNKLNRFHWHLVDDQGWRLEIRKYPRLTAIGGTRLPATAPGAPPLPPVTGHYTQDDVRDIVAFAAARGVTVVPEIELPGHALSALRAYPELGMGVTPPPGIESHWGVFPWLYAPDERTIAFLEDVFAEVIALFPSREIHVGGDEAIKDQWRADPRVQARIRELGVGDEAGLQNWMIGRIGQYLARHGRRLIGWDEILDAPLPGDAIVMSWRGREGAEQAAARGHDTILAAAPALYFDHRQGEGPAEPPGRGRVQDLASVIAVKPLGDRPGRALLRHLRGLQGQVWTEHVRTEDRVAWMAFPRALAVAEIGWAGAADYPDFLARLAPQLGRMTPLGLVAADTAFRDAAGGAVPSTPDRVSSTALRSCTGRLPLYLEDDYPAAGERARFLIDILDPCWRWDDAPTNGAHAIAVHVGQLPFNFQVGGDRDTIRFRPPATPAGEIEVRTGSCDGEPVARLPLQPATGNPGVTILTAPLPPLQDKATLCLTYTAWGPDPLWAIEQVRLIK